MKKNSERKLVVGLDFDGVICDTGAIHAREWKKAKLIAGDNIKLLGEILHAVYRDHPEFTLDARAMDGALKYIRVILDRGHEIKIVTARHDKTLDSAKAWLQDRDLSLNIVGVGSVPKTQATVGCDTFLDDFVEVLNQLPHVPNRFLFSRKYNRHDICS